jgi:hypothetical protein
MALIKTQIQKTKYVESVNKYLENNLQDSETWLELGDFYTKFLKLIYLEPLDTL